MHRLFRINDRRRFQRLSFNHTVLFCVDGPKSISDILGQKEIEATTLDLSQEGMALLTEHNIPAWSMLRLKFYLRRAEENGFIGFDQPITVIGEVRSSILLENNSYRLGIYFKEIAPADKTELANFIKESSLSMYKNLRTLPA